VCLYVNIHNYLIYAWIFNNFQHLNLTMMTWNVVCFFFRWFSCYNVICLLSVYLLVLLSDFSAAKKRAKKRFVSENVTAFVCYQLAFFISCLSVFIAWWSADNCLFSTSSMYLVLHCINKQEQIYTVQFFLYRSHTKLEKVLIRFIVAMIVLSLERAFQNCTVVLHLNGTIVNKFYYVNLSQAQFEKKRNWNSNIWFSVQVFFTSENIYCNINFCN